MGDIIAWKVAEEVIEILVSESAKVSGMSISEAATAYGYTLTNSGMYVKTVADIVNFTGTAATAGEAIAGTTATGGVSTTVANLTLYTTAEGTTAVGALGSVALPIASVCLVGAAGYALGDVIGDTIDRAYPDFFQGLFESISKFATGDKYGLAFIFDGAGRVYMPKVAQEAVIKYVEPIINVLNGESSVKVDSYTVPFKRLSVGDVFCADDYETWDSVVLEINSTTPVYVTSWVGTNGLFYYYMCSKEKFTITYKSTNSTRTSSSATSYGGKTNSKYAIKNIDRITIPLVQGLPYTTSTSSDVKLLYDKILGSSASTKPANKKYPKLVPYEMPTVAPISTPTEMPVWVPAELPSTLPQEMPHTIPQLKPDTELQPDTVTPYLPQPAPYPESVPLPEPVPKPNPNPIVVPNPIPVPVPIPTPSPEIDPSQEPVPTPSPQPSPNPPPPDTGETPVPPLPIIPPISPQSAGLLHVYNPTTDEINEFGKWLWTTFSGDLIDTIGKLFNNPMDAVIGLHELYCTPITGGSTTIKAGFLDSDVTSRLVTKRYVEINCNAIAIPEYWGNYLDYAPYTKVHCYLPFIGIVELNPNDIIGHGVQVVYKVDTYNGSCIAMIITAKNSSESVKYQFSGNCAVEVPITSGMKSALQSALIGAGTCAIGAVAGGVVAGATVSSGVVGASAVRGASQRGLNSSNSVSHSGSFGSSFGAMGIKKPYFIVERPVQKVVPNYNEKYGYPAHKMVTIGNCSGYLRCRDFEFKSTTATEEEKKLIEELLQKGVYV